jgi:transposase-like protein
MTIYPEEQKAELIERMIGAEKVSVPDLHRETGIPKDTLYTWRIQAQGARGIMPKASGGCENRWSSEEKFAMVVESAALNEVERGEYCRKRGLYPEQRQNWRRLCEQANEGKKKGSSSFSMAQASNQRRIRELERELHRKEKALAEAAALLVLRKKADAIWGKDADV